MSARGLSSEEEGGDGVVAEINITPLTDIFLVLLIIFMVTTSVIDDESKEIRLPNAAVASETPSGVTVSVTAQGQVSINDRPVEDEALAGALSEALAKAESKIVILRGDRELLLGKAVYILDLAQQLGAEGIALATSAPDIKVDPDGRPTFEPQRFGR